MLRSILAASVAAIALSSMAQAEDKSVSLGAGYERASVGDIDFDTVVFRAGYDFNQYFGVEGQANFGVGDQSVTALGVTADVSLDYSVGLFGVLRVVSNEHGSIYGRVGYTNSQIGASVSGFTVSADDNAWAYGVGGEYRFDAQNGVRFDYTKLEFDEGDSSDVYGVSYVRRFGG
jgi:outer membrane immunogenic protein